MHNLLLAILVVLVVILVMNTDACACQWRKCREWMTGEAEGDEVSSEVAEYFTGSPDGWRSREYNYNKDVMYDTQPSADDLYDGYSHDDYIRNTGIDKATVQNHYEWSNDPNLRPYWGSNFNARSTKEHVYPVKTWGLRRTPTRVAIGAGARSVPDIDERYYAACNTLNIGNMTGAVCDASSGENWDNMFQHH